MRLLYLDDSGKIHPKNPSNVVVFGGFSVLENTWHQVVRQISGAKGRFYKDRGRPVDWEAKGENCLTPNCWKRGRNRNFCFEIVDILKRNGCYVYAVSMDKRKAKDPLVESKFVPLAFHRLIAKFHAEVVDNKDSGSIVCDWSAYPLAHCELRDGNDHR